MDIWLSKSHASRYYILKILKSLSPDNKAEVQSLTCKVEEQC